MSDKSYGYVKVINNLLLQIQVFSLKQGCKSCPVNFTINIFIHMWSFN